jgi:gas vesicle protein
MKEFAYLLLGTALGAMLALLFAPESGKDLRASIHSATESDLTKLQADWQAAMAKTHERLDEIQADLKQARQPTPAEEGHAA